MSLVSILKEFKEFAMRGSVVDLAIGLIIGAEFSRIVDSFVTDIMMPPIGYLIGGVDFSGLKIRIGGTIAEPVNPSSVITVTCTVGFPRESRISRATTEEILEEKNIEVTPV